MASSIGLGSTTLHSTARWESSETTTTSTHATIQSATERGLIPVVRKASPIVEPHPTVSSGILACPIRKLSQETICKEDNSFLPTGQLCPIRKISVSQETSGVGINNNNGNKSAVASFSEPLTLTEALQLPLFSLTEECLNKSTDTTASSASSTGSKARPPLSPMKSGNIGGMNGTANHARMTAKKSHSKDAIGILVDPIVTTARASTVVQSTHQAQTLHTHILAEMQGFITMAAEDSQSLDSPSPRSITDYATAMAGHLSTGRRSLSKTLGVDFQEAAPIQPMRRPSSEPEQHHVTTRRSNPPHRLPAPCALERRQSSSVSISSSGSTTSSVFSGGSQNSSNCDTIATYPSYCSIMSVTSEATVKIKNGLRRNVTAGDEGTAPVSSCTSMSGAPKTRSLSFLPTPLEQVSERSISEHSESTYDTTSPTISNSKSRDALGETGDDGVEVGTSPKTPIFQVTDTSIASSCGNQREILFQPPSSPNALPVDHELIVDRFEDDSSTEGKTSKAPISGRFLRILKNKFR